MKYNMIGHYCLHTKCIHETEKNTIYNYLLWRGRGGGEEWRNGGMEERMKVSGGGGWMLLL